MNSLGTHSSSVQQQFIYCLCGCGNTRSLIDAQNRVRRYLLGHRVSRKECLSERGTHNRSATRKNKILICEWDYIGYCKGPLGVAHIDQNEFNNDVRNLIKLCQSHHALLDKGAINPSDPIMPPFFTDSGNKRRYFHTMNKQYEVRRKVLGIIRRNTRRPRIPE